MTDIEALTQAGELLYGPRWREPLARELYRPTNNKPGISWRLLRYWLDGERPVPPWVRKQLSLILRREAGIRHINLMAMANQVLNES